MSKGKSGGVALTGLILGTMLFVVVAAAAAWAGASYYYGEERKKSKDRLLQAVAWKPERVARADSKKDCDAGNLREESGLLQKDLSAFDLSKVLGFNQAASASRARGLQRTIKTMEPSTTAFLESYVCAENSLVFRDGREQQLPTVIAANGVAVASWLDEESIPDLLKVLWIGRDIQSTTSLYAFSEGVEVMDSAYSTLIDHLEQGNLDVQLNSIASTVKILMDHEESAQLQWQAGSCALLAEMYGTEWDLNPPTPLRAKAMVEGVDELVAGLNGMPDIASQPFPERNETMKAWLETNDMTQWDVRFKGFGTLGREIDAHATKVHAKGRALYIGLALREHKKKRSYCPRELEDLVTQGLLDALPLDPLSNTPFVYDARECTITSGKGPGGPVVLRVEPPKK